MKIMKPFRFLLILLLLLGSLMLWASAETLTAGGFTYTVNPDGDTVTITGSAGVPGQILTIPAQLDGKTVTAIGQGAFFNSDGITDIVFPATGTLTSIAKNAFQSCDSLVSVTLPEGLTTLAQESFGSCLQLRSVHIPSTLTDAGSFYGPFTNSDLLRTVSFAEGLETIAPHLFYGVLVESFDLPDSLKSIEANAFTGCSNLRSIIIPEGVTKIGYQAFMGCEFLTSVTLPSTLEIIGNYAFQNTALQSLSLPENLVSIGEYAFSKSQGLTHVVIPEGVTTLGRECFGNIDTLTAVHIPSSVTDAGTTYGPFTNSPNLRTVTFGAGTTGIPSHLFYKAAIQTIDLPDTLTTIGSEAFRFCPNLTSIVLPNSVTSVGTNAFRDCPSLTMAVLSPALTTIGENVFYECKALKQVDIPEGIVSLPKYMFGNCTALQTIALPKSLKTVGEYAFRGCTALTDVRFQTGLTTIGDNAFYGCTALEQIILPETVTEIRGSAFRNNTSLKTVYFLGDAPTISTDYAFPDGATLYYYFNRENWTTPYYPAPSKNKYPTCPIWGEPDLSNQDYFAKLADHHFKFRDPAGDPLTNVTVVFGAERHSSGENAEITARFADDAVTELTFEKAGYHSVTLPLEVLEGISVICLYPETWDEPYIQAAYARNAADGSVSDLLNGGWILTELDADTKFEFYVQTNWLDENPTCITLSKSPTITGRLLELNDGWNEAANVSATLQADSKLYLLQTAENIVELSVVIIECDPEVQMDMGDVFDLSRLLPLTSEFNLLNELDLGFDFTDEVNIDFQVNDDCTFTGVLGVQVYDNPSVDNDTYKTWNDEIYAKIHDGAVKDKDNLLGASSVKSMQNLGVTPIPKRGKFVIDSEVRLLGYVNGMFIKNDAGKIVPFFTEVGVGAGYSGAVTQSWQFPVGGQPHYATLALKGDVQVLVNFHEAYYGEILKPKPLNIALESTIEPRYGIGWDSVLNAGVRGSGTLESKLSIPVTKERASAKVNASIYAEASFFALHANIPLLELEDIQLNPNFLNFNAEAPLQSLSLPLSTPAAQWEPQSMDYLYGISLLDVGEDNTDTNVTTLASGVYPYAEAELAVLPDGTELAVWVSHGDNEPNNRTRLYYSYTVDGSWTASAPVDSADTTADFTPLLQVENGTAYLVWQDASRPLTNSDDVVSMASVMDVSVARFNGETFDLLGSVGSDDIYDGAMSLTMMDGEPTVVWASNSSNDLFSNSGLTYGLHRACWNGNAWVSETLAENLGAVDQTAAWNSTVWFSANADRSGNPLKRELYRFDGSLTQLTENEVVDSKPEVVNGNLIWFSGDMLTDGELEIPMEKVTDRYQYLQNGAMEALVYVVNDSEQQSGIYASFNDGSGWGEPIALTGGTTNIGSFSARFLADGSLAVLTLERSAYLDENNHIQYSAGTLNQYTVEIFGDLALDEVDYLATTLLPGNDLMVNLLLTNNGMVHTRAAEITVSDGETVLTRQVRSAELDSGVSDAVSLNVPLGETVPDQLTVTVKPIGYNDADAADNTAVLELHCTDLSVEEALATAGDGTSVTVMVANRGLRPIESTDVNLTDADGKVLATRTVTGLAVRSAQFVEFTLEETLEHNAVVYVEAPELGTENLISNNRIAVLVQGKQAGTVTEDLIVSATEDGVEVTVTLSNTTDAATTGSYICAAYDDSGKMLTCFTKLSHTILPGRTTYLTETFPGETAKVKLFRLDEAFQPVDTVLEKEISQAPNE